MNSLEKKMYAERQRGRMLCAAMLILILLLLLLSVYARLGPMLQRLDLLDSAQDLESYCAESRGAARLKYDSAEEIGSFVMTETDFYSLSLQSGGAYVEAPFGGSSKDVQYHVWLLAGRDFQVLYCTPEAFAGKGTVPVIYDANGSNARIAEAFGFADGGAYVLFHTQASTSWTPCLLLALAALPFIGYLLWAKRSKRYFMRSPLGREIAKRGDFDSVVRAFNEENCRFRCDTFEWYNDWILLKHFGGNAMEGTYTWILQPADALEKLELKRDDEEEDEYILSVKLKTYGQPFKIYISGAEAKTLPQF